MYKVRMVVTGFQLIEDTDYTQFFSPMVKLTTWALIGLAVKKEFYLEYLDVNKAFLLSDLDEEIYMMQPQDL